MTKKKQQTRTKVIFVRVTPAEHHILIRLWRSGKMGELGVGDWVRHVAMRAVRGKR